PARRDGGAGGAYPLWPACCFCGSLGVPTGWFGCCSDSRSTITSPKSSGFLPRSFETSSRCICSCSIGRASGSESSLMMMFCLPVFGSRRSMIVISAMGQASPLVALVGPASRAGLGASHGPARLAGPTSGLAVRVLRLRCLLLLRRGPVGVHLHLGAGCPDVVGVLRPQFLDDLLNAGA